MPRFEKSVLVAFHEGGDCSVYVYMWSVSEGEVGTLETDKDVSPATYSRMKMGKCGHGLYCGVTSSPISMTWFG